MKRLDLIRLSLMAGLWISVGGIINLKIGGILGAIFFSIGLLAVVNFSYKLYTGSAGFISKLSDIPELVIILFGNCAACAVTGLTIKYCVPDLVSQANAIVEKRLALDYPIVFVMAIACGLLMTFAVKFGRKGNWLPLLFSVPVFILSGYLHSIADAFYYSTCSIDNPNILLVWAITVIGNFIGCNLHRIGEIEN